jgi:hypothetical protein
VIFIDERSIADLRATGIESMTLEARLITSAWTDDGQGGEIEVTEQGDAVPAALYSKKPRHVGTQDNADETVEEFTLIVPAGTEYGNEAFVDVDGVTYQIVGPTMHAPAAVTEIETYRSYDVRRQS